MGYGAGLDGGAGQASGTAAGNPAEVLAVRPGETHLHLAGANLVGPEGAPTVRLNGRALDVSQADDDQMVVALPPDHQGGQLDIELYDGQVASFYVVVMDDQAGEFADGPFAGPDEPADPWMRR